MPKLDTMFRLLKKKEASDLHIAPLQPPRIRIHGDLVPVEGMAALQPEQIKGVLRELVNEKQWDTYEKTHDLDFAYELEGVGRFRANYFCEQNGSAAVFRLIPTKIIPLDELGLPPAIEKLPTLPQGLILVTGPTGSGKSTTLAAILDRINTSCVRHIITIEDPIEFVHEHKNSTIVQREVGTHTESFTSGLRSAMRSDPDVILVGEMRDLETISLAITAAEMGTLVFGTLHTNSAPKTIDRIVDAFPSDEQGKARSMLANCLTGIVSQLLIPTIDGKGRVVANEILLRTSALRNVIRENKTSMLYSIIQGGKNEGMQTMDDALFAHLEAKKITAEDAFFHANDKSRFEELL